MQIILISLKEELFSKSDALLGVYSSVSGLALLLRVPPSRLSSFLHAILKTQRLCSFFVFSTGSLTSACSAVC